MPTNDNIPAGVAGLTNPYVGPVPFTAIDRDRFFGRSQETRILVGMVMSCRAVLLFAQSGAGKSSLVQAGLIPALEGIGPGGVVATPLMQIIGKAKVSIRMTEVIRDPRFNPFVYSAMASLDASAEPDRLLGEALETGLETFLPRLLQSFPIKPGQRPVSHLLIFDQFEEIFTHFQESWQKRPTFFVQLANVLSRCPSLHVLISMREDFIAEMTPFVSLFPERLEARIRLERLGLPAALEAVRAPAWIAGRPFIDGVAEKLVLNLARLKKDGEGGEGEAGEATYGEWVEPMHLQIVCQRLWKSTLCEPVILDHHVQQHADVDAVLSDFYEDAIAAVLERNAALAPELLVREQDLRSFFERELLTASRMRGLVFQDAHHTGSMPNWVVHQLDTNYLIRPVLHGRARAYELSHDRLIAPIVRANQRWFEQFPIARTAVAWSNATFDRDRLLIGGEELEAAKQLVLQHPLLFSMDVALFVEESDHFHKREVALLETQRQQEKLERARQAELEQERKQRKTQNQRLFILTLVAALAALSGSISYYQSRQTDAARLAAEFSAEQAKMALNQAELAKEQSELSKAEAEKLRLEADSERTRAEAGWKAASREEAQAKAAQAIAEQKEAQAEYELLRNRDNNWMRMAQDIFAVDPALAGAALLEICAPASTPSWSQLALQVLHAPRDLVSFTDPSDAVIAVAYNAIPIKASADAPLFPKYALVAALAADRSILVWDLADKKLLFKKPAPALEKATTSNQAIVVARVSNSQTSLSFALADGTVYVASTFQDLPTIALGRSPELVTSLAFSPDESRLAAGTSGGNIQLWDLKTGSFIQKLAGHSGAISAVVFSPDGQFLASSGVDKAVREWSMEHFTSIVATDHDDAVLHVNYSPDGRYLVSVVQDGSVELLDREDQSKRLLSTRAAEVRFTTFSTVGRYLVTGGTDGVVRVWPVAGGVPLILPDHKGGVKSVEFSSDESRVLTLSDEGVAYIWSAYAQSDPIVLRGHRAPVLTARFSPDGKQVITGGADRQVKVWDIGQATNPLMFRSTRSPIFSADLSGDGRRLAAGGYDGTVRVWSLDSLAPPISLKHGQVVSSVSFSPTGWLLATGSLDHTARAYRVDQHVQPLVFWGPRGHSAAVTAVRFSPLGDQLLTGSTDGTARIWKLATSESTPLIGHRAEVSAVDFHPDGQRVVTASVDRRIIVWKGSQVLNVFEGHRAPVLAVRFSADGSTLVSADSTGQVRVWRVRDGASLGIITFDGDPIRAIDIDAEGRLLLCGTAQGLVQFRALDGMNHVFSPGKHGDAVNHAAFSRDQHWAVTSAADGTIRLWPAPFFPSSKRSDYGAISGLYDALSAYRNVQISEVERLKYVPDLRYPDGSHGCRRIAPNLPPSPSFNRNQSP